MGKLFSVRVRKRIPVNLSAKNSHIRKLIRTSERQTGWKALHSRPVMSEKEQAIYQDTKITRKLIRICTGKALDNEVIYDKQKRANIQRAMQTYVNAKNIEKQNTALKTILKELGSEAMYRDFLKKVHIAQIENLRKM
ncbi:MAG: hypothetical protein WC462_00975 [archaeon]